MQIPRISIHEKFCPLEIINKTTSKQAQCAHLEVSNNISTLSSPFDLDMWTQFLIN